MSEDNTKNEEMCELETHKISKVLDSISEVMKLTDGVTVITSIFDICKTL
jgi:hypothetical protein